MARGGIRLPALQIPVHHLQRREHLGLELSFSAKTYGPRPVQQAQIPAHLIFFVGQLVVEMFSRFGECSIG